MMAAGGAGTKKQPPRPEEIALDILQSQYINTAYYLAVSDQKKKDLAWSLAYSLNAQKTIEGDSLEYVYHVVNLIFTSNRKLEAELKKDAPKKASDSMLEKTLLKIIIQLEDTFRLLPKNLSIIHEDTREEADFLTKHLAREEFKGHTLKEEPRPTLDALRLAVQERRRKLTERASKAAGGAGTGAYIFVTAADPAHTLIKQALKILDSEYLNASSGKKS